MELSSFKCSVTLARRSAFLPSVEVLNPRSFEAERTVANELSQKRCRLPRAIEVRKQGPLDIEHQIGADEVGVLQRWRHAPCRP